MCGLRRCSRGDAAYAGANRACEMQGVGLGKGKRCGDECLKASPCLLKHTIALAEAYNIGSRDDGMTKMLRGAARQ